MSIAAASSGGVWAQLRGYLALLLLALYRIGRCALAGLALAHWTGIAAAVAVTVLLVGLRWTVMIQLAALIALVRFGHWPVWMAAIAVAPRLVLVLPGLVNTWLASVRHPRPRWSAVAAEPRATLRVDASSL